MEPKVSVIVPVYNVEKYVLECLESVERQTYENIEVIVVDDGSSDNSAKIVKEYIRAKKKFKLIQKENGGPASTRNVGLEAATGEWVVFLDSDDFIEDYYIEQMVQAVQDHGADYCESSHQVYYEDTGRRRDSTQKNETAGLMEEVIDVLYFRYIWRGLYSMRIIRENNLKFDERIYCGEDNCFNFDYFAHIKRPVVTSQVGYVYRRNENSITAKHVRPEKKKNMYGHVRNFCTFFDKGFLIEKIQKNSSLRGCMLDAYLADVINAVLECDKNAFNNLIYDPYGRMLVENCSHKDASQKTRILVAIVKAKYFLAIKLLVKCFYSRRDLH